MTISGKEETRVRPAAWLPSDCSTNIPLKKRKFLFNRSPSPPNEESSPQPEEDDLQCQQLSSISQGSAYSGTVSIATSASCQSDANKNAVCLAKRSLDTANTSFRRSSDNQLKVEKEESSVVVQSVPGADIKDGEKLLETEVSVAENLMEKDLKLASIQANPLTKDTVGYEEQKNELACLSQDPVVAKDVDLLLGTDFANQNNEKSSHCLVNEGALSLNLSLSKGDSSTQDKNGNSACNSGAVSDNVKRSRWDLNTTMDAWEGDTSDNLAGHVNSASLSVSSGIRDVALSMCLDGIVGTNVDENRGKEKVRHDATVETSPTLVSPPYTPQCSLSLGLRPLSLCENPSSSSNGANRHVVGSVASCSRTMVRGIVKSEPHDEAFISNTCGAIGTMKLIGNKVKLEERCCPKLGVSNKDFLKLADPTLIKREPTEVTLAEAHGNKDEVSNQSNKQMPQDNVNQAASTCTLNQLVAQVQHAKNTERILTTVVGGSLSPDVPNTVECSVSVDRNHNNSAGSQEQFRSIKQVTGEDISLASGRDNTSYNASGELPSDAFGKNAGCLSDPAKTVLSGALEEKKDEISNHSDKQMPQVDAGKATTSTPNQLLEQVPHSKDTRSEPTLLPGMALRRDEPNSAECLMHVNEIENSGATPWGASQSVKQIGLHVSLPVGHQDRECNVADGLPSVAPEIKEELSNQSDKQMSKVDVSQASATSTPNQLVEHWQHSNDTGTNPSSMSGLALSEDVPDSAECLIHINEIKNSGAAPKDVWQSVKQVGVDMMSSPVGRGDNECNASSGLPSAALGKPAGFLSDDRKSSSLDDTSGQELNGSNYNPQQFGHPTDALGKEKSVRAEDFEDGEVHSSVFLNAAESLSTKGSRCEHASDADFDDRTSYIMPRICGECLTSTPFGEKDNITSGEISDVDTNACSESVERPADEVGKMRPVHEFQRKPSQFQGKKGQEEEHLSNQCTHASPRSLVTATLGYAENPEMGENSASASIKADISSSVDDQSKDAGSGASQSRIINLSQVSNKSFASATPFIPDSIVPLQTGRETRNFHSRGRDEGSLDFSYKFSRERHHDRLPRNPHSQFGSVYGKGRLSGRIDTTQRNQGSERELACRFSGDRREFAVCRNKYESTLGEIEFDDYNSFQDGGYVSTGRRGRRLSNNDTSFFSHMPSRRRSPEWRPTPADGVFPFTHRGPRIFGRGRYAGEAASSFREFRHREKFCRALPHENPGPVFRRRQHSYEQLQGDFVRENSNFYSLQGRDREKIRSRSPIKFSAHSPDVCSSFRNRSLDGFDEHAGLHHRRCSPNYRMQMMRSPDAHFSRNMITRRHDSPTFLSRPSNISRDMDSGRCRTYTRSAVSIHHRSDGVSFRNRGKFNNVGAEERAECDYFGRPMCSGQFDEFDFNDNIEERRRFRERGDVTHSFRHHFDGDECKPTNTEVGPETSRFCEDINEEFHEQESIRQFDGQVKNIVGNMDENEANPTHEGQVWADDNFGDISQTKRKRF